MENAVLGSEFAPGPTGNMLAEYDGFAVSYVGHGKAMIPSFETETADGETALMIGGSYYILNGDWRMAYSELAPRGADACLEFFRAKAPQFKSQWSE
jgi:hypothetical protein